MLNDNIKKKPRFYAFQHEISLKSYKNQNPNSFIFHRN